jgi:hypothetical protein
MAEDNVYHKDITEILLGKNIRECGTICSSQDMIEDTGSKDLTARVGITPDHVPSRILVNYA